MYSTVLTSLTESAFSIWLTRSESLWGYPTVLTLHTFGMMVLVGAALVINLRLLGFAADIPLPAMGRLFRVLWGAFAINAVTGTMLFIAAADTRGVQPLFWTKLALVAIGLLTTVMIRRGHFRGDVEPVAITSTARLLAVVSVFAWIAAITAGRLLAYVV
jgi:hypothetical protein